MDEFRPPKGEEISPFFERKVSVTDAIIVKRLMVVERHAGALKMLQVKEGEISFECKS